MNKFTKLFMYPLDLYLRTSLVLRLALGFVLGIAIGLMVGEDIVAISFLGNIFIRLLNMLVVPIIILSLITGISHLNIRTLGTIGIKIIFYFMLTSVIAIIIGLLFGNILTLTDSAIFESIQAEELIIKSPSMIDILLDIIPLNPFEALNSGNILAIMFFSILIGIGLSYFNENDDKGVKQYFTLFIKFFDGCNAVLYKIIIWVLEYAPIGIFSIVAVNFGTYSIKFLSPFFVLIVLVYDAYIVHIICVYFTSLFIFKIRIASFIAKAWLPIFTAFTTRTSLGTLPISIETAEKNMGISKSVYSFVLPMGAMINKDGVAIYLIICTLFICNALGIDLSLQQYVALFLSVFLSSIATIGLPNTGIIMIVMVLNSLGLDVAQETTIGMAYSIIVIVDVILDMPSTCLNVTGDLVGTTIIAKSMGELDQSDWV